MIIITSNIHELCTDAATFTRCTVRFPNLGEKIINRSVTANKEKRAIYMTSFTQKDSSLRNGQPVTQECKHKSVIMSELCDSHN